MRDTQGQVRKLTEPVVNPEIWNGIEQGNIGCSKELSRDIEHSQHNDKTDVRNDDELGLILAEDSTGGLKVAHMQPLANALLNPLHAALASGSIEEQIRLPSKELMADKSDHLSNRRVLEKLSEVNPSQVVKISPVRLSGGHKRHVLVHVASEAVVTVVRELPGEVRHQEEAV